MSNIWNGPLPDRVIWDPVFITNDRTGEHGLHIRDTRTGEAIGSLILEAFEGNPALNRILEEADDSVVPLDEEFIPIHDPNLLIAGLENYIHTSPSAHKPFTRVGEKNGQVVASFFTREDTLLVTNKDVAQQILGEIAFCLDPVKEEWD